MHDVLAGCACSPVPPSCGGRNDGRSGGHRGEDRQNRAQDQGRRGHGSP
jgi:hypothetical protein